MVKSGSKNSGKYSWVLNGEAVNNHLYITPTLLSK